MKALTSRDRARLPTPDIIAAVNRVVQGWAGYFQHCAQAFSALRRFVAQRVRIYLRRKHRQRTWEYRAFPDSSLYGRLGLYRLPPGAAGRLPASAVR